MFIDSSRASETHALSDVIRWISDVARAHPTGSSGTRLVDLNLCGWWLTILLSFDHGTYIRALRSIVSVGSLAAIEFMGGHAPCPF